MDLAHLRRRQNSRSMDYEPNPAKLESLEFLENATLVDLGIVNKLSTFYERKYDGVFEAGKDGPNPLRGERVS